MEDILFKKKQKLNTKKYLIDTQNKQQLNAKEKTKLKKKPEKQLEFQ